ncbi:hypothetical protein FKZ61_008055 [Litorilinea aerophila]|uniref:DUF1232 domain-containing protein n=1 Tax=Litorilinea aerophila TaxID=1204385 RepID=A0A540VJY8_9CHLR|nr:hypothetical protein [Litorilinea aerophila]MCC9076062.1 hypothetical protein [Litorilinea aerophila]OUC05048.1 hypothetical protein RY27_29650 [Litorilinea aerophila]GIV80453.1 MAG: hypothetical protein KatS3mg050_4847 [Litorilinea sp.]
MRSNPSFRSGGWNLTAILRDLGVAWRLLWDPAVPTMLKLLLPVLAMVYWLSPIDLLPGMPFDDLALLILAARLFVQMAPADALYRAYYGNRSRPTYPDDDSDTVDTTWRVVED